MNSVLESELQVGYVYRMRALANLAEGLAGDAVDDCKSMEAACTAARAGVTGEISADQQKRLDDLCSDLAMLRHWASQHYAASV